MFTVIFYVMLRLKKRRKRKKWTCTDINIYTSERNHVPLAISEIFPRETFLLIFHIAFSKNLTIAAVTKITSRSAWKIVYIKFATVPHAYLS